MRCRKVTRRLLAFLDGEIGEREKERIARHLKTCGVCGEEAKTLSSLWTLLDEGKETITPSPYFWNKLEQRIAHAERDANVFGKLWERLNRAFIPAAVTAALIIGLFIGTRLGEVVYSSIANTINPENLSLAQEAMNQSLSLNTLDNFPRESIGGVYTTLNTESTSTQQR